MKQLIVSTGRAQGRLQTAHLNSKEYHVVEKDGKRYYEHRLKAGLGRKKKGRKSKLVVDHKNNSKKQNGKENLKVMTRGANVAKANRRRG